jgi:hypothetical protein
VNGVSCLVNWVEHAERSGKQATGKFDMLIPQLPNHRKFEFKSHQLTLMLQLSNRAQYSPCRCTKNSMLPVYCIYIPWFLNAVFSMHINGSFNKSGAQ